MSSVDVTCRVDSGSFTVVTFEKAAGAGGIVLCEVQHNVRGCFCPNGTPQDDSMCPSEELRCQTCDAQYALVDGVCIGGNFAVK